MLADRLSHCIEIADSAVGVNIGIAIGHQPLPGIHIALHDRIADLTFELSNLLRDVALTAARHRLLLKDTASCWLLWNIR